LCGLWIGASVLPLLNATDTRRTNRHVARDIGDDRLALQALCGLTRGGFQDGFGLLAFLNGPVRRDQSGYMGKEPTNVRKRYIEYEACS
jgi:hypothetical protein